MKKYLYIMIAVALLFVSAAVPVYADTLYPRLTDEADVLTDAEEAELLEKLDRISSDKQVDIVICTVLSVGEYSAMEYTDNLFEDRFYGMGNDRSCILLLISMEYGDWHITTAGYGITALTDVGIDYIGERITPMMSDGNFAEAFLEYASLCERFIDMARSGNPFDADDLPKEPFPAVQNFIICLVIGTIAAWIITGKKKAQLITVRKQTAAKNYTKEGSLKIDESKDLFLYKTVTRSERSDNSGSSSTHTTKSGTTVGGGGGKF